MTTGILGRKLGMTRVYDEAGVVTAVTVIEAQPNVVAQIKTVEKDGYKAVQLAAGDVREKRLSKAVAGHYKKNGLTPKRVAKEFPLTSDEAKLGDTVTVGRFQVGQLVDVIGVSKGRGFQGVIRRHGFHSQPETHGSMMHRRPGSIGCRSTPGRVFKNKPMPGHMGDTRITVQNLQVIQVREDDNLLLIKGAIPGSKGSLVVVRDAIKGQKKAA
ncbi:MAG: 50S ribosomal protein L3 [Candidatus Methylacidiphilales bacterium]